MQHSNTSLYGLSYSYWSLEVNANESYVRADLTPSISDPQLISNIRGSNLLIPTIRQLALTRPSTPTSSLGNGTPRSHHSQSHSYQETETGEGQGEIQLLARRILEFAEGDDEILTPSAMASQMQAASFMEGSSVGGRSHEELRKSVREAFSGSLGH